MRYLFLLYGADPMPEPGTPEHKKMFEEYTAAVQAMARPGC
jgi:hypothetical protein